MTLRHTRPRQQSTTTGRGDGSGGHRCSSTRLAALSRTHGLRRERNRLPWTGQTL